MKLKPLIVVLFGAEKFKIDSCISNYQRRWAIQHTTDIL